MKTNVLYCAIIALFLFSGCGDTRREAESNMDLLRKKALALDSLLEAESRKIQALDSAINDELGKTSRLDSLISVETTRIDSLVNEVYQKIQRQRKK